MEAELLSNRLGKHTWHGELENGGQLTSAFVFSTADSIAEKRQGTPVSQASTSPSDRYVHSNAMISGFVQTLNFANRQ